MNYIKVFMSEAERALIRQEAEQLHVSQSCLMRIKALDKPISKCSDKELQKEIIRATGILGKYIGMLKIHVNKYELKDHTQAELRQELKEAIKAREEIRKLIKEAFK